MSNSLQIKRILTEQKEIIQNKSEMFFACPTEDNIFIWHFTLLGPDGSAYENGLYHGKIELSQQYPLKPPDLYFLNPNGRFEIKEKICLNFTKFHPENWNPSFTIRSILEALVHHFPIDDKISGVGALVYTQDERKKLANLSHKWNCENCGVLSQIYKNKFLQKQNNKQQNEQQNNEQQNNEQQNNEQQNNEQQNNEVQKQQDQIYDKEQNKEQKHKEVQKQQDQKYDKEQQEKQVDQQEENLQQEENIQIQKPRSINIQQKLDILINDTQKIQNLIQKNVNVQNNNNQHIEQKTQQQDLQQNDTQHQQSSLSDLNNQFYEQIRNNILMAKKMQKIKKMIQNKNNEQQIPQNKETRNVDHVYQAYLNRHLEIFESLQEKYQEKPKSNVNEHKKPQKQIKQIDYKQKFYQQILNSLILFMLILIMISIFY